MLSISSGAMSLKRDDDAGLAVVGANAVDVHERRARERERADAADADLRAGARPDPSSQ